jgi:hypothetical protein
MLVPGAGIPLEWSRGRLLGAWSRSTELRSLATNREKGVVVVGRPSQFKEPGGEIPRLELPSVPEGWRGPVAADHQGLFRCPHCDAEQQLDA